MELKSVLLHFREACSPFFEDVCGSEIFDVYIVSLKMDGNECVSNVRVRRGLVGIRLNAPTLVDSVG